VSDALARMAVWLVSAEPNWRPDRFLATGPNWHAPEVNKSKKRKVRPAGAQAIKALILTALERAGPQTGAQIAARIRCDYHSVNSELSRMYYEKLIAREKIGRSSSTGRTVMVYALRPVRA